MRALAVVGLVACSGGGGTEVVDAPCRPGVLYLNRTGGLYDRGPIDDAVMNRSVILDGPRMLPPYPHAEIDWRDLVTCVRAALAPFPIQVTETEPAAAHVEIVFTTSYWAGPAGTTMVIPDSCRPGHQIEFVFGSAIPTAIRACHMAMLGFAQMTALVSVADECNDYLNLEMDCGPSRSFLDRTATCVDATNQPTTCRCGGSTTQNGFQAIAAAFPACP